MEGCENMAIDKGIFENLKDDKRIKAEIKKISDLFQDLREDKKALAQKLIENAAFMGVLLDDLQADIKKNGYKDEYKNGANQYGAKRSIAADLYQTTIKNYGIAIKQLNELLPENVRDTELDEFDRFVKSRDI